MLGKIVLAGITGTAIMTLYVYLLAWSTGKNWKVVHVLSALLQRGLLPFKRFNRITNLVIACIIHYAIGVLFTWIYWELLNAGITTYNVSSAVIYGVIIGAFAILVWRITFAIHPDPPTVPLNSYLPVIGSGHILFALGMIIVL